MKIMKCVYLRAVFLRLGDIQTAQETFKADFLLQCRWREPKLDQPLGTHKSVEVELENPEKYWNPKIAVDNNIVDTKGNTWYVIHYNHKGEAYVCERRRVKSTFYENMELNQFPFDMQDLTVSLSSLLSENDVVLREDSDEASTIHENAFTDQQEWDLHDKMYTFKKSTSDAYVNEGQRHPTFCISCKVTRRPFFFITNVVLISLVICGLVFTTFSVDLTLVQNRLQLSFILLLSNITFKFASSQGLPKVSYLTSLDKYVLLQMGTLCTVCVWHSAVFAIKDANKAKSADHIALYIIGGSYILMQFGFVFYWAFTAYTNRPRYIVKRPEVDEGKKYTAFSERHVPFFARFVPSSAGSNTSDSPQQNQIQPLATLQIAQMD